MKTEAADPSIERPRAKNEIGWRKAFCVFLVVGALTAVVLEVWTRVKLRGEFGAFARQYQAQWPMLELTPDQPELARLKPNVSRLMDGHSQAKSLLHFGPLTYTINSLGFRGREVSIVKQDGVKRVMFLGDSFTFGWGVNDDETFTVHLERELNRAKKGKAESVECLNFGVPGYNTIQELALLREKIDVYQPDAVVLVYYRNDTEPNYGGKANPRVTYKHSKSWLWEEAKSGLNRITGKQLFTSNKLQAGDVLETFANPGIKWKESREALEGVARECEKRGIPLLVMIQPAYDYDQPFNEDFAYLKLHATVASWCEEFGVKHVDLLDHLEPEDNIRHALRGDGHTNPEGHKHIATVLEPHIRAMLDEDGKTQPLP